MKMAMAILIVISDRDPVTTTTVEQVKISRDPKKMKKMKKE